MKRWTSWPGCAGIVATAVLTTLTPVTQAAVTLYTDLAAFNAATGNAAELFTTTAGNIALADEVSALPSSNTSVGSMKADNEGSSLTFHSANTGLLYSFTFTALENGVPIIFDNDQGGSNNPNFDDTLSPGDINQGEDDDWRIRLVGDGLFRPLRGFAFEIRDNSGSTGETIRLYNATGQLVHEVPIGTQPNGSVFLGVVSDEPFTEISYDEDAGGDDIAVADFRFVAGPNPPPTALDMFAATLLNTTQNPQSVMVTLQGSDEASVPLAYSVIGSTTNGVLSDPANGDAVVTSGAIAGPTLRYTPNVDFSGTDAFTYRVNDGNSDSQIRTGTITVFESYRQQALLIGGNITGEAQNDQSGWSLSLSSDGQTLAIGAPWNAGSNGTDSGHVRVYRRNGTNWVQRGGDIDGEAFGDISGYSVSLSGDGQTLAVGAPSNDGSASSAGHVRIYRWDGISWIQRGNDIDGQALNDQSAAAISLSSDGQTVAIGAYANDNNGTNSGHVRVYRWDDTSWIQRGDDIDGEAANDVSGTSVSLSSDGQTLAIGAPGNDGNGDAAGHVRIYRWDGANWLQRGSDIDGEAADDRSGHSVSLSNDGQTVAIGAKRNDGSGPGAGHVRIYRWDDTNWSQRGGDIDGEAPGDASGSSVSLSSDGQAVAIGAEANDGKGHARIYRWDGISWVQLGGDIDGAALDDKFGYAVALAGDAQAVAIGAVSYLGAIDARGYTGIYDLTLSAGQDNDNDGVSNGNDQCPTTPAADISQVNNQGCAPTEIDSDGDGTSDPFDDFPNDPSETTDTDGDGLGDNREGQLGTLPNNPDTDGDGFNDFDEVEAGSDPLSANEIPSSGGLDIILIKAAIDQRAATDP